jgi:hypothetical protein
MASNSHDINFYFDSDKAEFEPHNQLLVYTLNANGFQNLVPFLNTKLSAYPITQNYFNEHIKQFEQKSISALDKNFLISTELDRFEQYINQQTLKTLYEKNYVARGFYWAMAGNDFSLNDFFQFVGETKMDLNAIYSDDISEERRQEWLQIPGYVDRAALGYSYALYVKHLKGLNIHEYNLSEETTEGDKNASRGLSARAKILVLKELGFFDLPLIKNCNAETLAPIVAAIIGNGLNVDNIGNAISNQHGLKQLLNEGKRKKELEQVNNLLATIKPKEEWFSKK